MTNHQEPVNFLRDEFGIRRARNLSYSLRAYSRDLGISPARLSEILNRKRTLTAGQIDKIAEALALSSNRVKQIFGALERRSQGSKLPTYTEMSLDVFKVVAEWYHSAILSLLCTKGAQSDTRWIAARLGISSIEAKGAIERLLSLGLLSKLDGKLVLTKRNLATTSEIPSAALRKYHSQMLTMALQALKTQKVDERSITSVTIAVDKQKLAEAKDLIKDFRRRLTQLLENDSSTEVYELNVQLFKLTKRNV